MIKPPPTAWSLLHFVRFRKSNSYAFRAISGFRCEVDENCAFLGNYATYSGKSVWTFRDNRAILSSRFKNPERRSQFVCIHYFVMCAPCQLLSFPDLFHALVFYTGCKLCCVLQLCVISFFLLVQSLYSPLYTFLSPSSLFHSGTCVYEVANNTLI